LIAGIYTVTIHVGNGYGVAFSFEVPLKTAKKQKVDTLLMLSWPPNPVPARSSLGLKIISPSSLPIECSLWNVMGRKQAGINSVVSFFKVPTPEIPGLYLLILERTDGRRWIGKVIVH
jgi:hypothetical protein